jgi:hypothetical protein
MIFLQYPYLFLGLYFWINVVYRVWHISLSFYSRYYQIRALLPTNDLKSKVYRITSHMKAKREQTNVDLLIINLFVINYARSSHLNFYCEIKNIDRLNISKIWQKPDLKYFT